MAIYNEYVA